MSETTDYQLFKKHVISGKDRCTRIENLVGVGEPDVNYCISGVEGWIEIKSPKEPKRASTRLLGSNHKLSQDQMNWHLAQQLAGGISFILLATDKRWILIDGSQASHINELSTEALCYQSLWWASRPIVKSQWSQLRDVLQQR